MTKKYQDKEWLRTEYVDKGRSTYDIASDVSVTQETVRLWLERHEIDRREKSIELPDTPDIDDEDIVDLYHDEKMDTRAIAEQLGCSREYIRVRLHESDAPPRTKFTHKLHLPAYYHTNLQGYECWQVGVDGEKFTVPVHRLLAVCEYGFEALNGKHVHHENHIPWDNRSENLSLMSPSEHARYHSNVTHGNCERGEHV